MESRVESTNKTNGISIVFELTMNSISMFFRFSSSFTKLCDNITTKRVKNEKKKLNQIKLSPKTNFSISNSGNTHTHTNSVWKSRANGVMELTGVNNYEWHSNLIMWMVNGESFAYWIPNMKTFLATHLLFLNKFSVFSGLHMHPLLFHCKQV